jgi:hypothetical protein
VQGLVEEPVTSYKEALQLVELGSSGRAIGSTALNEVRTCYSLLFAFSIQFYGHAEFAEHCRAKQGHPYRAEHFIDTTTDTLPSRHPAKINV